MAECKACGRWFSSSDPKEEICYPCKDAIKRLNGYAVPVVRCGDCAHRHSSEFCECRPKDAFCSDGERKEEKKQVPPEATRHLTRRFEQIE